MDVAVVTSLISVASTAISALFWQLMREKDRQITDLKTDNGKLEDKVDALNNIVGQNTTALEKSNTNTQVVIELIRHMQQSGKAWTTSPPEPPLPGPR